MENLNVNPVKVETEQKKPLTFRGRPLNGSKVLKPLKIMVYGDNGVGKSCFAARSKNPIFLDLEGNIEHLPEHTVEDAVFHKERLKSFKNVEETLEALLREDHDFKTLVIDSLDTLFSFAMEKIKGTYNPKELGYGGDYKFCAQEFNNICKKLDDLRDSKNMSIVLLAHAKIKTIQNPLINVHDRWETTLNDSIFRLIIDWVSCVFFAVKEIAFKDDDFSKKDRVIAYNKAKRWLYTSGNAAYFAKNIYNLPERIEMDWDNMTGLIRKHFNKEAEI